MRLLVTGAAGMLGHEVVAAGARLGHEIVAWDLPECDLTDAGATLDAIRRLEPRAVINCAAYTNVDGAEADEATATLVNGDAAGNVAHACAAVGARLVHVSTDYVFDGSKREPWVESDPTSPLGAYGRSKLHGEDLVRAGLPDHAIVRTAWLFGPHGPNFVSTMLRLASWAPLAEGEGSRDEVEVVTDQVGSPTFAGHLAPALVDMAERTDTGIFHGAGSGSCSWYELTLEAFDAAGVACRVLPTTAEKFARPAPRPAYSVLGSEREHAIALPPWQEGVRAHLAALEGVVSR
jgi:dTDP-4-dehydrorhamnose reductase